MFGNGSREKVRGEGKGCSGNKTYSFPFLFVESSVIDGARELRGVGVLLEADDLSAS
jgi:hypothetical protein